MGRRLTGSNGDLSDEEWGTCYDPPCSPTSESPEFSGPSYWSTLFSTYWGPISVVLISIFIILIGWLYLKKRRAKREHKELLRYMDDGADVKLFELKHIKNATNDFKEKNIIGRGAQGEVYRGLLLGDIEVAIKKSLAMDEEALKAFRREIKVLSRIRHPNIVVLIGCSYSERNSYLVYEFLSGGDLFVLLHGKKEGNNKLTPSSTTPPWSLRYNIALKVAEALSFLHFQNVLHRDVKARNVLLDIDNNPKLADFGISRFSSLDSKAVQCETSLVKGTLGYMCPEYALGSKYDASCDTFSFGVLLAELLTGLKAVIFAENGESIYLFDYFANVAPTDLERILDPKMKTDQEDEKSLNMMKGVAAIACMCVAASRKERPTMLSVWNELKQLETSAYYDENKDEVMSTSEQQLETTNSLKKLENEEDEVSTCESETAPVGLNMV